MLMLCGFCSVLSDRFTKFNGSECPLRRRQPTGMDRSGDGAEEAQTIFEVSDARTRERVPLQRVRQQTEALGARAQPQPHRATGEDLVPESADEEQEDATAADQPAAEQ